MPRNNPAEHRLYARVHNFPNKLANLRAKIEAMAAEAQELGFHDEARHLKALLAVAVSFDVPELPQVKNEWTASEVATLKALWAQGETGAAIGERLGRSRTAVLAAARRNGLGARR